MEYEQFQNVVMMTDYENTIVRDYIYFNRDNIGSAIKDIYDKLEKGSLSEIAVKNIGISFWRGIELGGFIAYEKNDSASPLD